MSWPYESYENVFVGDKWPKVRCVGKSGKAEQLKKADGRQEDDIDNERG